MAVKNPECPVCGDTFKDGRGLSGHLQFKHGLSGDEHKEKLDEGMERGEKATEVSPTSENRSIRDRELELKGLLLETREAKRGTEEKIAEVEKEDSSVSIGPLSMWTDTDTKERLRRLEDRLQELQERESDILDELDRLSS
jgi:hypothetical protein